MCLGVSVSGELVTAALNFTEIKLLADSCLSHLCQ